MSTKIGIYGGGGLGREVLQLVRETNQLQNDWEFIGFFDDQPLSQSDYIGDGSIAAQWNEELAIIIAVANPSARFKIAERLSFNPNIYYPNFFHPGAHFSDDANRFGKGNIVCNQCHFTTGISIGEFNFFNVRVTVGHDTAIGNYNMINTNVTISGNVSIGDCNFFGFNAGIHQGKSIGNFCHIGAASLVLSNVKDNEKVFGIPAFKI